jgi:hypothetical protein
MTVRVYRSTDASAPVLTGQVGSLTALLDAVLVNGYGALTAAGWSINQTTTNKRGYKQNLTGSNNTSGMLLYVDDTGPGAGGAREARVCGFETMSAITPTGTGQFPTAGQSSIGVGTVVIRKSNTADATARAWTIIANGQTIYLFIETGDVTSPLSAQAFMFGDFKAYKSGDQYAVMIMGRQTENAGSGNNQYDPMQMVGGGTNITLNSKFFGHYVARSWSGLGGSVQVGKTIDMSKIGLGNLTGQWSADGQLLATAASNFTMGRNTSTAQLMTPNGPDGALWVSPVYIFHNYAFRGYMPGLWAPLHDRPFSHNDTMTLASGNLNGKSLLCQQFGAYLNISTTDAGQCLVEYSDTWT